MAGATGIDQVLVKFVDALAPIINMGQGALIWYFSYFLGVIFGIRAAWKLKLHNDNPQHYPLGSAVATFLVTACLLSLPSAMDAVRETIGLTGMASNPLGYIKGNSTGSSVEAAVYIYVAFFGYIAFIRGLFLFNKAAEPNKQGGEIGRGITHVVGGVMATNLAEIVKMLKDFIS